MIEELSIRDLGVIADAKLEFSKRFTVVSGETGAGKTMVLTALGLLLGDRADSARVRLGAESTHVEGRWYLGDDAELDVVRQSIAAQMDEAGVVFDGELILSRQVSNEGRSKAVANGRAIPVSMLSELGVHLVVVHGQADQQRLKSPAAQREALDSYGGVELAAIAGEYGKAYAEWLQVERELVSLRKHGAEYAIEFERLMQDLEAIEQLSPTEGEFAQLTELAERLENLDAIRNAVQGAHEAVTNSGFGEAADAISLLGFARKSLEAVASSDAEVARLVERLHEILGNVSEVATDLSRIGSRLEGDLELSLDEIQSRRAKFIALGRRLDVEPDELLQHSKLLSERVLKLDSSDAAMAALEDRLEELRRKAEGLAIEISDRRVKLAADLEVEVTAELAGLAMANSRLVVQVQRGRELRAWGLDEVSIMLGAPGSEPRALGKGASGGELSRIMLAIEVVLAKNVQSPTFIFDEVDAGVGGAAAIEIGRRLARLAKQAQVIVVTHLAQVAAFADRHIRVLKSIDGGITSSGINALISEDERLTELARMLSGLSGSSAARENAAELVALARQSVE
ncbi:MAG: hypothetical protein RL672_1036 [Actinomycetota bacterium]